MANQFSKPYVNPYPHNGHVDIVQPNTSAHEHIDVQNRLGAKAIQFSTFGPPKKS